MLTWRGYYLFAEGRGIVGVISSPKNSEEWEHEFNHKQYKADPLTGIQVLTDDLSHARTVIENIVKGIGNT